ncbi:MAG: class I SAM-dependent methyltransferase [Atribacterota bacterium]
MKNKKEFNCDWYNNYYSSDIKSEGEYSLSPEKSMYYKLWVQSIKHLNEEDSIAEFGCGVGQFAKLLNKSGNSEYIYGVDFSGVAINQAKINNSDIKDRFFVMDLYKKETYYKYKYNTVVMFEVLEHIKDDIFVLQSIPKGVKILFSVPSFDYISHVRFFKDKKAIKKRYCNVLNIKSIKGYTINNKTIWLVSGYK